MQESKANPKEADIAFSAEEEEALKESLKRCSPDALDAALAYRKTGNTDLIARVVLGIIERFLEPDQRPRLRDGGDDLRVIEDLGIDSLTLMEIVFLVEETLCISINNEELRDLRTVADVKIFIECKAKGEEPPQRSEFLAIEQILALMPQQPPFLFLQEATLRANNAEGKYKIGGVEFFLEGHFKNNPVFPASILLESLGQLAVLYLIKRGGKELGDEVDSNRVFFTSCEGVRVNRICRPGDVLKFTIKPVRLKPPLATFEGTVYVGQERAAIAEEITLTFAFVGQKTSLDED